MRLLSLSAIISALLGASRAIYPICEYDQNQSLDFESWTVESLASMASTIAPIIPIQTTYHASTLETATRAAALNVTMTTTSDFVLRVTAIDGGARRPTSDSSSTIAFAIVIPLICLISIISAIVFRMYRSRKEWEEAAAAAAARAKTKLIEQQIYDMETMSEKFDLEKYRTTSQVKDLGTAKDISIDIPIELEADEPQKRRYHGL